MPTNVDPLIFGIRPLVAALLYWASTWVSICASPYYGAIPKWN